MLLVDSLTAAIGEEQEEEEEEEEEEGMHSSARKVDRGVKTLRKRQSSTPPLPSAWTHAS